MRNTLSPLGLSVLTFFTLVAFAANSILCRLALGHEAIDAASFSTLRILSGALVLWLIVARPHKGNTLSGHGNWTSGLMLFLYAVPFSFAYVSLSAGTGALILFAAVQATMILAGVRMGERPGPLQWSGLGLAGAGLVYLLSPGLTAPSPVGSAFMALSGIAWGIYSVRGRGVTDPFRATAGNFARAVPFALATSVVLIAEVRISTAGAVLAIVSGAVTSGLGYVAWYWALRGLTTTKASIVQLAVPVLAALGGAVVLSEAITLRLVIASVGVLGGVGVAALTLQNRSKKRRGARPPGGS